jgi:hypothetical protein
MPIGISGVGAISPKIWGPGGAGAFLSPITLEINYTTTQFVFKFKLPSANTVTLNWGDGTTEDVTGQDSTLITKTSAYSGAGTYTFSVGGDVTEITYIDIGVQTFVSGDVSNWSKLINLTEIKASITSISGDISSWSTLTSLTNLQCRTTPVSGDISGWATLTSITTLNCYDNDTTFDGTDSWSNTSGAIRLEDNAWTSQEVDNAIASLKTCTNCTINIAGNNAHRTAASNDDLNTLLANGNTITLNDVLGSELHTDANAASPTNEADATTGWTQVGLDARTGLNVSNCVNGDYDTFTNATPTGFDVTDSGAAFHQCGTADEISIVSGEKYVVKFDMVLNSGTGPRINIVDIVPALANWSDFADAAAGSNTFTLTATATGTGALRFSNNAQATNYEVTNLSVSHIDDVNVFESQSSVVSDGSFALHTDANDTPTNGARIYKDIETDCGLSNDDVVRLSIDSRHIGTGTQWSILLDDANNGSAGEVVRVIEVGSTTFQTTVYYWTHSAAQAYIVVRETATNSGGVFVDNLSLKKVTLS